MSDLTFIFVIILLLSFFNVENYTKTQNILNCTHTYTQNNAEITPLHQKTATNPRIAPVNAENLGNLLMENAASLYESTRTRCCMENCSF